MPDTPQRRPLIHQIAPVGFFNINGQRGGTKVNGWIYCWMTP